MRSLLSIRRFVAAQHRFIATGCDDASRAHCEGDGYSLATEITGRTADEKHFPGFEICREKPTIGHEKGETSIGPRMSALRRTRLERRCN